MGSSITGDLNQHDTRLGANHLDHTTALDPLLCEAIVISDPSLPTRGPNSLDVTLANDVPFAEAHKYVTEIGKGVAIKAFDSSVLPNWKLVDYLRTVCEKSNIPHQIEILPRGGTDTAAIQRAGSGAAAGCISVPTRYVHSVIETMHPDDIEAAIQLLATMIESCESDQFAL